MFGIGASELIFIIFIALMLFGADKIPEIARTLGKGMAQLKNATNDIKSEITKSVNESGIDTNALTKGVQNEIRSIKQSLNATIEDVPPITEDINTEIEKAKINIEDIVDGPIKRTH